MQHNQLLILGAGAWGSALALVAGARALESRASPFEEGGVRPISVSDGPIVWDHSPEHIAQLQQTRVNHYLPGVHFPDNIQFCADLANACQRSQDILVVVSSIAVREVLQKIKPYCRTDMTISIASKGLDPSTGDFFQATVQELFGTAMPMGVLSGPSFAMEVAKQLPTAVTFATDSTLLRDRIIARLNLPFFRLYHSTDVVGVQLGGVVKNVIAIAAGIADGLALGANARSALVTRGLAEMMRLGHVLGAKFETLAGLSGVGDLILTCTDNQSRNHRFGVKLGQGYSTEQALTEMGCLVEGVHNVAALLKLARHHHVALPITEQVHYIVHQGKAPQAALHDLLSRDLKPEIR